MCRTIVKIACLLVWLLSAHAAEAAKRVAGLYAGLGGGFITNSGDKNTFGRSVNFKAAEVLGGAYFKWFAVETRIGQGLVEETLSRVENASTGATIVSKAEIENYESVYIRLQLSNDIARIYTLLGQSEVTLLTKPEGEIFTQSIFKGSSYGMGAGVNVSKSIFLNAEFKYLLKDDVNSYFQTSFNIDFSF